VKKVIIWSYLLLQVFFKVYIELVFRPQEKLGFYLPLFSVS